MSPLDYIIRPDQEPKDSVDFEKRLDELVVELKDLGSDYMTGMSLWKGIEIKRWGNNVSNKILHTLTKFMYL